MKGKRRLKLGLARSLQKMFYDKQKSIDFMELNFQHHCELPPPEDLVARYICAGSLVHFRRKLKSYLMCSEKNARTKLFFKSSNAVLGEKFKHLEFHFNMIHPFSVGRAYWEFFMMIVFILVLIYIPYYICATHQRIVIHYTRLVFDIISYMDMCLSFCTGYQHSLTKRVIMRRKKVVRFWHYLVSWFIVDILSSINPDILVVIFYKYVGVNIWYIRLITMIKILRIRTVLQYLTKFKEWHQFSWLLHQTIKISIIVTMTVLWNSSVLFLISYHCGEIWMPLEDAKLHEGLEAALSRTIGCLLVIGEGGQSSTKMLVFILEIIYTVLGWIFRIIITSQIALIAMKSNPLKTGYNKLVQEFEEYISSKQLPRSVKKRVVAYLEFRFRRKYYKESVIFKTLSNRLREEINVHICRNVLSEISSFRHLPHEIIIRISHVMKHQIYLPNDVIANFGAPFESAIFVTAGVVAVYNRIGREVNHILDGQCYGEIFLFVNDPVMMDTIVAVDYCEIYTISQENFRRVMGPYPEIWSFMAREIKKRVSDDISIITNASLQAVSYSALNYQATKKSRRPSDDEII